MKRLTLVILFAAWALASCQRTDDSPAPEVWEVTAILTTTGLGDLGYNDQMYLGFCMMREELGCDVLVRFPESIADACHLADEWHDAPPVQNKHRLLVLCDETYSAHVKETGWTSTPDDTILQLDSEDESLPVYTRYISLYGGCQTVGQWLNDFIPSDDTRHAAVVLSNPYDKAVNEGREGFLAGAREAGVEVDTYYLCDEPGKGYALADSLYHLCYEIAPRTAFLLPLAGGSNNGVYRYGRENHEYPILTCALDSDLAYTSYSSVVGIMKNIDLLLLDFYRAWQSSTPQPQHATYDLSSGYVTVKEGLP